jgi:hypothetical protein
VSPQDRWAHRRGEPRVFAFLWTIFLFAATATTFLAAVSAGYATPEVMRPATRALLAVVLCGVTVLWPMVRLSQAPDHHPIGATIQDLVVVLIPAQAVIWPQWLGWLGRWPLPVISAVAALCVAWGLLTGGLLALAQTSHALAAARRRPGQPARWMCAFIALSLAGAVPAAAMLSSSVASTDPIQEPFRASWMLSPIPAIYELTRDRSWSGISAVVTNEHWKAIGLTAAAAIPLWLAAIARSRGLNRPASLH